MNGARRGKWVLTTIKLPILWKFFKNWNNCTTSSSETILHNIIKGTCCGEDEAPEFYLYSLHNAFCLWSFWILNSHLRATSRLNYYQQEERANSNTVFIYIYIFPCFSDKSQTRAAQNKVSVHVITYYFRSVYYIYRSKPATTTSSASWVTFFVEELFKRLRIFIHPIKEALLLHVKNDFICN